MGKYNLPERITELSVAQDWLIARIEWHFEYLYVSEEPETCLCGNTPIFNICVIKNTKNKCVIEIGNECVKNFLGFNGCFEISTYWLHPSIWQQFH